ncbi:hypothetical protein SERLA73DRAFT_188497 [Serpula lacrymans var. lacrymans S7.3]|uniref:Pex19-domain-containing protein n=2 Tax=Serpula lacrymans var. lacrymans TaxID=341189 RepID=F8QBF2_SERL3|nr:uncharacterized protein SERLADRAFT_478629 [Serpula lacrymans var. lacrymans S7.9]EGN94538.1 hypothetical protein SERLA73DRAFT_188497 [Serpula lacrymans var. lacrymans S7.3]EGO20019.1 hypothetical protein SERLADRAFT_478629 [Serpula lacrymans var. lacrymans S7.9]
MESFMREITAEFEAGKAGEVGADTEGLGSGLGGLGMGSGDPPKDETPEQKAERLKREESFAAAWEAMLVEGMNGLGVEEGNKGATAPSAKASSSGSIPKPVPPPADDYQARIRATMNKLKESESTLNQSQNQASSDPLEALLAQLGQGGLEGLGEGEGGEEQLQGMLETMMGQLMSKDVLYEPLKELSDKFPAYLTKNAATLSASDKSRYEAQVSCIERLLVIFDAPGYKDDNKEKKEEVLHAMSELQSHGSPPEDLMGPLPPGFSMGADGLPNMGAGGDCVIC